MSTASSTSSINGRPPPPVRNKGHQTDTLIPYFTHPNENPTLVLVSPLLSTNNYHSWSRSMTMTLRSKNKLHFINDSLPQPLDEEHDSFAWDRCNIMIMPWLHNSVELEIAQSVLWMGTAPGIWNELMDHFYQGDVFRILDLQEEICNLKQGDSSISSYCTKFRNYGKIWIIFDQFINVHVTSHAKMLSKFVLTKMVTKSLDFLRA